MDSLGQIFENFKFCQNKIAIDTGKQRVSFAELGNLVGSWQDFLERKNLHTNSRALVLSQDLIQCSAFSLACFSRGIVPIYPNPGTGKGWLNELVKQLKPEACFGPGRYQLFFPNYIAHRSANPQHAGFEGPISTSPDQETALVFSSGSTAQPKIIRRRRSYLDQSTDRLQSLYPLTSQSGPELTNLPGMVYCHLANGRGVVAYDRPRLMEQQPTSASLSPHSLRLAEQCGWLEQVDTVLFGGAAVSCEEVEHWLRQFPHIRFLHVYGSTEVEPIAVIEAEEALQKSRSRGDFLLSCVGQPLPIWQTKLSRTGELIIDNLDPWIDVFHGFDDYANQTPSHTFKSGDAIIVENNDFYLQGRHARKPWLDLENKIYHKLGHSQAFIWQNRRGKKLLVGDNTKAAADEVDATFNTKLQFDRRHRSRIDYQRTLRPGGLIKRSLIYFAERIPLPVFTIIGLAPVIGLSMGSQNQQIPSAILSFLAITLTLAYLRLRDDLHDLPKDLLLHPERALPRGLIEPSEAHQIRRLGLIALGLVGTAFLAQGFWHATAAVALVITWLLALDYAKETHHPIGMLWSALLHQAIILPLFYIPFAAFPGVVEPIFMGAYIAGCLISSLMFELARRFLAEYDRDVTYRHVLGNQKVYALLGGCLLAFTASQWWMGFPWIAGALGLFFLTTLCLAAFKEKFFPLLPAAAGILNLVQLWLIAALFW